MVVSGLSRVGFGLFIDMMFLRVYLGLRRKKAGKSREAENSREAEKRRSREVKEQKSREAKKQGKTEKQENREAETDSKKQKTTPEKICSLICGCSNAIRAKAPACLCRYIIYFDTFSSTQVFC